MRAAAVTGAAGFIGTVLIRHLLSEGVQVVGIDRRPPAVPPPAAASMIVADLLDGDADARSALASADYVFHLAGRPGVRDQHPDVVELRHRDNVEATRMVVETIRPGTRLVVTSSSSVYGGCRAGSTSREDTPVAPRGGYAESKLAVERLLADYTRAGGNVLVARLFTAVGEGQRPDMALSRWISATLTGTPIEVFGSLERSRDFTDVREVAWALTALGRLKERAVVNVGSGQPHTLRQCIEAIEAVTGRTALVHTTEAAFEEMAHTCADTTFIRDLLGRAPLTDLMDAVRRTYEARRAEGTDPTPPAGVAYRTIATS
ncbi:NAD-dependent epimerase/dehydratase family protein [soil metagenome]